VDDAGDLVPGAGPEQGAQVGNVTPFDLNWRAETPSRQLGRTALQEHAFLARVQQGLHGMRANETESAGYQDHR